MLFLIDESRFSIIKLENLCSLLALNGDQNTFSGFSHLYVPEKYNHIVVMAKFSKSDY